MAESWDSLLADRASRSYSRLPTESPSPTNLSRLNFSNVEVVNVPLTDGEQERPQSSSMQSVAMGASGSSRQSGEMGVLGSSRLSATMAAMDSARRSRLDAALGQRVSKAPMMDKSLPFRKTTRARTEALVEDPTSCWRFVESDWFQVISAVVIVANVITTIMQMDKPQTKSMFFISDQAMLGFYVLELCSRANYMGNVFLCGPGDLVCWNYLDIIVVVAGVLDQWLLPILPVGTRSGSLSKILILLRLLRLLRVFKIVKVFLETDLSWTEKAAFQSTIGLVIVMNSLLMGVEIDIPWSGWFYFEQVLLCIYVFELGVRLKNFGTYFFACSNGDIVWNILDFIIVISSVLDSWITPLCKVVIKSIAGADEGNHKQKGISLGKVMMLMRMLRLMRILRLAKLIKSIQPLYILVTGVMAALQGVVWVLVLTIVTLYAMGILATSLIAKKMGFPPGTDVPEEILTPFNTVPNSMFTLFRVMSGAASDAESFAIDHLMENIPALKLAFVFFMITSSWTLLSILTAVVSDNMISTTGLQEEEIKLLAAEEDRFEHVERLTELFNTIDVGGDGQVERDEIETFLENKANSVLTARRCRVPVRDVREVLQTVADACEGTVVSIETFVDHLADVPNPVTQKSVMKIEAILTKIMRQNAEGFNMLHDVLERQQKLSSSSLSKQDHIGEASSKTFQSEAESTSKVQLQDVERLMQGLVERTEISLHEHEKKHQRLFETMSEALECQLGKMQNDLLCNLRGQASDVSRVRDGQGANAVATLDLMSEQESSLKQNSLILHGIAGSLDAIKRENGEQPSTLNENQADVLQIATASGSQKELTSAYMEARLLAIEESIHGSQQKTEDMLRRLEGPLEKMSTAVYQGFSSRSVENFSAILESELRIIRQELRLSPQRVGPDISKARNSSESDNPLAPVFDIQSDLPGRTSASGVCVDVVAPSMEERLLATEKSILGLQQQAESMLKKIEGLLEKAGLSTCAFDKFSETLERELRMMRQELLCSLRVSRVKDGLLSPQKGTE